MLLPKLQSIRENLTFKDVVFSGTPTAGTYTGYLNGYLNDYLPKWIINNPMLGLSVTLFIFLVIIIILYCINNEANKKSLAEILANGYFLNFSGKLTSLLKQGIDITLIRSSGLMIVKPNDVKLEIYLPTSKEQLKRISSSIDESTEIVYIDSNPFIEPTWWMKIKIDTISGKVLILETPRTLFALPNYLSTEYTEERSKKMHKAFNKKFRQLVEDHPEKLPSANRFEIIENNL